MGQQSMCCFSEELFFVGMSGPMNVQCRSFNAGRRWRISSKSMRLSISRFDAPITCRLRAVFLASSSPNTTSRPAMIVMDMVC